MLEMIHTRRNHTFIHARRLSHLILHAILVDLRHVLEAAALGHTVGVRILDKQLHVVVRAKLSESLAIVVQENRVAAWGNWICWLFFQILYEGNTTLLGIVFKKIADEASRVADVRSGLQDDLKIIRSEDLPDN